MIKCILVPATGSNGDAAVFGTALAVARAFSAHLEVLHVRVDAVSLAAGMATDGAGALAGGLLERVEADSDARERQARNAFDTLCRESGLPIAEAPGGALPSAAWRRETGAEPYWVSTYGRTADLIVAGRPGDESGVLTESIEAALLQSGRPLLIAPAEPLTALPEAVVIAWKPTTEAARAVAAAMPLIEQARRVEVLTVEETEPPPAEDGGERLAAALGWHGVAAAAIRLTPGAGGAGETLIAAARERSALLVMGGYGHSRLREWVFGGVTERVLRAAPVPVLMAH